MLLPDGLAESPRALSDGTTSKEPRSTPEGHSETPNPKSPGLDEARIRRCSQRRRRPRHTEREALGPRALGVRGTWKKLLEASLLAAAPLFKMLSRQCRTNARQQSGRGSLSVCWGDQDSTRESPLVGDWIAAKREDFLANPNGRQNPSPPITPTGNVPPLSSTCEPLGRAPAQPDPMLARPGPITERGRAFPSTWGPQNVAASVENGNN